MTNIQSIRQSNLFAAEDWRTLYKAFNQINFTAYDFDTIKQSMVDYIRNNFAEDFNDWVESSEFVALIDLLAYLGQSLAFRMDLNTRENFIDVAERKESILRLARLLSYQPKRNQAANGIAKIVSISTTDAIIDGSGNNLSNVEIVWNNSTDNQWFEKWLLVINEVFSNSNIFGNPNKIETINGIPTQLYKVDNATTAIRTYPFSINADGLQLPCEVVNPDLSNTNGIFERNPNPNNSFHLLYQNDGNGNASKNTGFFAYFKQGNLTNTDFVFENPLENRVVDVDVSNINQDDVFVQSIQDNGLITQEWTKVPSVIGNNAVFNEISNNIRNIFSVHTRNNDQVSIRFGDGRFGNIPIGSLRVWHRTSINRNYSIKPNNLRQIPIKFNYLNSNNQVRTITLKISLQEEVSNATTSQDIEDIRQRAPQVYFTQDRMVSGEDYNVFPLDSGKALKIKAINRTFSGHSIYLDHNDPTGNAQNTKIFSDDGMLYRRNRFNKRTIFTNENLTPNEIVTSVIQPMLQTPEFYNAFLSDNKQVMLRAKKAKDTLIADSNTQIQSLTNLIPENLVWKQATESVFSSTGSFFDTGLSSNIAIGQNSVAENATDILEEGSLVRFRDAGWVTVLEVSGVGSDKGNGFDSQGRGRVTLNQVVLDDDEVELVIPTLHTTFAADEITSITGKIGNSLTFAIYYDLSLQKWLAFDEPVSGFSLTNKWEYLDTTNGLGWGISFIRNNIGEQLWNIRSRELEYIFESETDVRFFNPNIYKIKNPITGKVDRDRIRILSLNNIPSAEFAEIWSDTKTYAIDDVVKFNDTMYRAKFTPTVGTFSVNQWLPVQPFYSQDIDFAITSQLRGENGLLEDRRIQIQPFDSDDDGVIDDPNAFDSIITEDVGDEDQLLLFFEKYINPRGDEEYRPFVIEDEFIFDSLNDIETHYNANTNKWTNGLVVYLKESDTNDEAWYKFDSNLSFNINSNPAKQLFDDYRSAIGRKSLKYMWQHYASNQNRIDPAISNVIDIFALTRDYDENIRRIIYGNLNDVLPLPPSETELKRTFNQLESNKMSTDQIIWKPAKYRLLFGQKAEEKLRAKFRAIRIPTSNLSDGELRAKVLDLINDYFILENWDFGETFYATEMIAYLHQNLATDLASIVLVPSNESSVFGNLFQIKADPNEIFLSCATINDIEIISNLTENTLRVNSI